MKKQILIKDYIKTLQSGENIDKQIIDSLIFYILENLNNKYITTCQIIQNQKESITENKNDVLTLKIHIYLKNNDFSLTFVFDSKLNEYWIHYHHCFKDITDDRKKRIGEKINEIYFDKNYFDLFNTDDCVFIDFKSKNENILKKDQDNLDFFVNIINYIIIKSND